jgi:ABC-2 type transport system ATP-binding protein/lipopolysaccharide transport system ATP-binding protein
VEVVGVGKRFRRHSDRRGTLKELLVRGRPRQVDDFWALRDVSLAVPKGSVYGFIGHNGSGKSTMLKVMAGIYRPSEGSVTVNGRLAALIELGAGFHPDLTGRENIRLNGSILGLSRKEIESAADEIVDFSGLGDFVDEPVKNYSSGMYVRLGFSVAVHMRPDVLLVDEVIAVGDEDFQRKCFDHLYRLRKAGRTIVIVSHATTLLASLCDEVAWLDHGSLVERGTASAVVDGYLASVNAVEGAGPSPERDATMDVLHRSGTGQVRFSSVEILGPDGSPATSCVTGEPLRLRLAYQAHESVDDPVFAVAIRHETGAVVSVVSTRVTGDALLRVEGSGRIDYVQDPCRLNPGAYQIDVSILDRSGTHAFDAWTTALDLVVRQGHGIARAGLVSLPDAFDISASQVQPAGTE